jgi:hypothetical protein
MKCLNFEDEKEIYIQGGLYKDLEKMTARTRKIETYRRIFTFPVQIRAGAMPVLPLWIGKFVGITAHISLKHSMSANRYPVLLTSTRCIFQSSGLLRPCSLRFGEMKEYLLCGY